MLKNVSKGLGARRRIKSAAQGKLQGQHPCLQYTPTRMSDRDKGMLEKVTAKYIMFPAQFIKVTSLIHGISVSYVAT